MLCKQNEKELSVQGIEFGRGDVWAVSRLGFALVADLAPAHSKNDFVVISSLSWDTSERSRIETITR